MIKKIKKNKRAVSLMISYVLLIAIAIGVSIGVYSWMKKMSGNTEIADCKDETSIVMTDYKCSLDGFEMSIRNNGRFNVSGFILTVSNDSGKEPVYSLIRKTNDSENLPISNPGIFYFSTPLKPSSEPETPVIFTNKIPKGNNEYIELRSIEKIQIQPFILVKKKRLVCKNAIIKQKLENCIFG